MEGELTDLVVDPAKRCVTHLVVEPKHAVVLGPRLVPIALAQPGAEERTIALRCTAAEFGELDAVREFAYERLGGLPVDDADWDVGVVDVLAPPYAMSGEPGVSAFPTDVAMSYDRVPKDDVELRRASPVQSCDGHELGHVEALLVDDEDRVTQFVLQHRRFFRRRDIKVPVSAIKELGTDSVTLALTRTEVRALARAGS
jgi:sporulation protein YlmC with PRC-barrel domain